MPPAFVLEFRNITASPGLWFGELVKGKFDHAANYSGGHADDEDAHVLSSFQKFLIVSGEHCTQFRGGYFVIFHKFDELSPQVCGAFFMLL